MLMNKGQDVPTVAELNKVFPPGASVGSGNRHGGHMVNIVFSSVGELRSKLRAMLGVLQGVDRLEEEQEAVATEVIEVEAVKTHSL